MNVYIPLIANLLLSIIVFVIAIKVYSIYKRKYIKWFLIALFFIPLLFIYSFFEMFLLPYYSVLLYPLFIIVIEVSAIMAQRNLLFSLRTEESKEYKILLREDIALIRDFEKIANYLIGRISPLIGVKSVENVLENCIEKYPILAGCYIGIDEKLKTMPLERNIEELKGDRMKKWGVTGPVHLHLGNYGTVYVVALVDEQPHVPRIYRGEGYLCLLVIFYAVKDGHLGPRGVVLAYQHRVPPQGVRPEILGFLSVGYDPYLVYLPALYEVYVQGLVEDVRVGRLPGLGL